MRFALSLLLLLSLAFPAAAAEDEGLYDPPPPAGAALVRNLSSSSVKLGDVTLSGSVYRVIMRGRYEVEGSKLTVRPGERYSIIKAQDSYRLLADPQLENSARTLLVLYNLSEQPALELVTAIGRDTIISGVMMNEAASRMVQPVGVKLAIASGKTILDELDPVLLERGATYSIITTGSGETVSARLVKNETAKFQQ